MIATWSRTPITTITLSVLALLPVIVVRAAGQTVKRFQREAETSVTCNPDFVRLRWSGRMFLSIEANESRSPVICTASTDGLIERTAFTVPDAAYIFVYDVTASRDGTIALVGTAISDDSRAATFVARLGADRTAALITRVSPYVPRKVTIAPDKTIWTVGWVRDEAGRVLRNNVLKSFDSRGVVVRTLAPQVTFRAGLPASVDTPDFSVLRSSLDRIGWLTASNEYIEFALDGGEIARFAGPPLTEKHHQPVTFALSEDNDAVVGSQGADHWDLWTLDRKRNSWTSVEIADGVPNWGEVLGFDGASLLNGVARGQVFRYRRDSVSQQ